MLFISLAKKSNYKLKKNNKKGHNNEQIVYQTNFIKICHMKQQKRFLEKLIYEVKLKQ